MGKATPEYNLAVIHPKVSKEWHPTKNKPLTLDVITSGSRKKVWWKCKKGHEWEAIVKDRTVGSGCPECSGRFPTKTNNLYVKFSEVAGEWHPTKNKNLTPKDVTPGSDKKVWWKCEKVHEWIARVGERSRGSGCPYCSGRYPTKTNNLYVKFPEVAKAWHPTKNKPLTAKDVTSRSNQKVWWKCTKDHEWDATIASRSGGNNCPECSGKKAGKDNNLQFKFPKVAKEWHSTKNIPLTSKDVTSGSAKKVWWQCNKGHEWEATIKRRALRVDGCPECSGKKAGKDNNLQLLHAKVAKEWHPTKNKSLTSKDVTPGSAKKVWWQCNKGHEWESVVQSRVTGGRNNKYLGCPLCSGRIPHREHNLHIKHPDVAKEWHPTKNTPLTSKDVTPRSNKKVWWKCKKSHEWEAIVQGRSKGNGCPYCSGRFPTKTNNLYVKFSEVAKEWHLTKNKTLTPKDVTPGSGKKVWWKCKKGHEWAAIISNRSQGTGCPLCRPNISKIQIQVFCELKTIFKEIFLGKRIDKIECDIYLSKYKIAIEYDGYHWHKGNEKKDRKKNLELNKKGVALFRIRERQLKKISLNDVLVNSGEETISVVKKLLKKLFQEHSFSSTEEDQINKYNLTSKLRNIKEHNKLVSYLPGCLPQDSFKLNFPEPAKQWNFKRNDPLQPEWFSSWSNSKVWWQCDKGHEWEAIVSSRSRGRGCPECVGKKVGKDNNLSVKFPEVAGEWHPTKNKPLTPIDVTSRSDRKVWWACKKGHGWEASIANRSKGSGCPECSGYSVGKDNNLQFKLPEIAKEWHPTKNKSLTPKDVTSGSKKKVWWQCNKGHAWEAQVTSRSRGSGCPKCYKDGRTKKT